MLKTTRSSEKLTSKELEVGDGEVVRFAVSGGDDSLNRKIVQVQKELRY